MQHTDKYRPLDREGELASGQQFIDHRLTAALGPQPLKHQRRPDAAGRDRFQRAVFEAGKHHRGLTQPGARAQQRIELSTGLQFLSPSQRGQYRLPGFGTVAGVLDDLQIAAIRRCLDSKEHAALPQEHRNFRNPLAEINNKFV